MMAHPMMDGIWFDKYKADDAEKAYQEKRAQDLGGLVVQASSPSSQTDSANSGLAGQIARARQNIQNTLNAGVGLGIGVTVDSPALAARLAAVEKENAELRQVTADLQAAVSKLTQRVNALDMKSSGASAPAPAKKEEAPADDDDDDDDDDDVDLFGDDSDDEEELAKMQAQRKEQEDKPKKGKKQIIAKSSIILDVKPWDDETDMLDVEKLVRTIQADGLLWGASKLVPLAYGIKKLQIGCVVEDDKIGTDFLEEEITKFEDMVQSVDIAAFNKI